MRLSVVFVATLVAAAVVLTAVAQGDPGEANGPPNDMFVGSGKIAFTDFPAPGETTVEQDEVSAHSGPNGEDAQGMIMLHSPLADEPLKAEVVCLVVNGNHAVAGATFPEPVTYNGLVLKHMSLIVTDTGSEDTATGLAFIDRPRPPGFSPCNFVAPTIFQVVQGNFVVKDGSERGSGRFR